MNLSDDLSVNRASPTRTELPEAGEQEVNLKGVDGFR